MNQNTRDAVPTVSVSVPSHAMAGRRVALAARAEYEESGVPIAELLAREGAWRAYTRAIEWESNRGLA
jgi:hypothetical protein